MSARQHESTGARGGCPLVADYRSERPMGYASPGSTCHVKRLVCHRDRTGVVRHAEHRAELELSDARSAGPSWGEFCGGSNGENPISSCSRSHPPVEWARLGVAGKVRAVPLGQWPGQMQPTFQAS